jgi:hypothetical protein
VGLGMVFVVESNRFGSSIVPPPIDSTCLTQIHSIDELPNGLDSSIKIISTSSSCSTFQVHG